jgi:FkbM family methyltransferase
MAAAAVEPKPAPNQFARAVIGSARGMLGEAAALACLKRLLRSMPMGKAMALGAVCLDTFPVNERTLPEFKRATLRFDPTVELDLHPQCLFSRLFALTGFHEYALTRELLSPKYTGLMVDIGSNFGYYAALWLTKPGTSVIAVEPVPSTFGLLERNLRQFGERGAAVHCCIGDREEVARLSFNPDWPMHAAVKTTAPTGSEFFVPMRTLPSLLASQGAERVDVLKIDAEGFDVKILDAARPMFAEQRVQTVFWEYTDGAETRNVMAFLERCGYRRSPTLDGVHTGIMGFSLLQ